MFTTLVATARRRHLGVAGALLAAAALAACDKTDNPTSPALAPAGAASKGLVLQIDPTVIKLTTLDEKNAVVKWSGAEFELWGPFGLHKIIDDNGPEDSDNAFGQLKLVGFADGTYTICEINVAMGFMPPPTGQCVTGYLGVGGQLSFTFFNPRPPYVQWNSVTDVGTLLGGGSVFTVKDSLGAGWTITDDDPLSDSNPWAGGLQTSVSHPGTWTICETKAPAGYVKPAGQPCANVIVTWGSIGWGGTFANNLPYSANWGVTEGVLDINNNYVPLAGATFTVAYQRGLSKTTITDNGPGDYDPRPGRLAMKLGAAGSYTVCEVTAPANHWLPKPPCQSIYVSYATPAFVGWFITPQSQVIYVP
jgi:hypothetical protein